MKGGDKNTELTEFGRSANDDEEAVVVRADDSEVDDIEGASTSASAADGVPREREEEGGEIIVGALSKVGEINPVIDVMDGGWLG